MRKLSGVMTMLLVVVCAAYGQDESNGTSVLSNKVVTSSWADCKVIDVGQGLINEAGDCSPNILTYRNGESRVIGSEDSAGFVVEGGQQVNLLGFTSCVAGGKAYWVRGTFGESGDALHYFVAWAGVWFPRKADNSLDTVLKKEIGPARFCQTPKQIADGGEPTLRDSGDTPIVIDLNGDGLVRLTNGVNGVLFDLDADGVGEQVAWLDGSEDALLVWDLDENGHIANGKYLFGNHSVGFAGSGVNGYQVLRRYDENKDQRIDALDQGIWPGLYLWRDLDHDGVSDAGELVAAREVLKSISLDYKESRRRDNDGNQFRYRAPVEFLDGRRGISFDVILTER